MIGKKIKIEIVIPIYNEENELQENIYKLYNYSKKYLSDYIWKITIADNASFDNSFKIAKYLSKKLKNVDCFHLNLKGRGRAVKEAWNKSDADILVYMDADLSTNLYSLNPLLTSLKGKYDIAIGSRLLTKSKVLKRPIKREILSRGYNFLIKIFFGTKFSDAQCGFKAVTRKVIEKLIPHIKDNAWFFDSELLIVGEKSGFKIHEEPVTWVDNPGSTVRVLKTVLGDLAGLFRIYFVKSWRNIK